MDVCYDPSCSSFTITGQTDRTVILNTSFIYWVPSLIIEKILFPLIKRSKHVFVKLIRSSVRRQKDLVSDEPSQKIPDTCSLWYNLLLYY